MALPRWALWKAHTKATTGNQHLRFPTGLSMGRRNKQINRTARARSREMENTPHSYWSQWGFEDAEHLVGSGL